MKPRITLITLGVDDLAKSLEFYRDGLPTRGIVGEEFEHGAVAFFDVQHGLRLALWPRRSIAHDTGIPIQPPSATDLTIGHNVTSKKKSTRSWRKPHARAPRSSSPPATRSGAATPATSKTPTATSGRSRGIRRWRLWNRSEGSVHSKGFPRYSAFFRDKRLIF